MTLFLYQQGTKAGRGQYRVGDPHLHGEAFSRPRAGTLLFWARGQAMGQMTQVSHHSNASGTSFFRLSRLK